VTAPSRPKPRQTHTCPGCHQRDVPRHQLSCRPCWYRLPPELRDALNAAYHKGTAEEHGRAMRACLDWYRDNPR
jgi:hypothetical protein